MILAACTLLAALIYTALIVIFFVGWKRLSLVDQHRDAPVFLSVVVAARDAEKHIRKLLQALATQDFSEGRFEVILVDDYSEDGTAEVVAAFIKAHADPATTLGQDARKPSCRPDFRLVSARDHGCRPGKKQALALGISQASGEVIVTTDADCLPPPRWLKRMSACFADPGVAMVLGPLRIRGTGLFGGMQELEYLSLMGITGGAAGLGHPVMCNGANLAFRKASYLEAGGYEKHKWYASGDDVFLMHDIKKQGVGGIRFIKDHSVVVETEASTGLRPFFRQRGRWAGKAGGYTDFFTLFVGGVVAGFNAILFAALVWVIVSRGLPWSGNALWLVGLAAGLKFLADFLLVSEVARFFGMERRLWLFPLVFLLYPLYVLGALAVGILRRNKW